MNPFYARVYEVVGSIPHSKVVTYGQIALLLGRPRSARVVGQAMRHCPDNLPWHRVVKADGSITGGGYAQLRRAMLEREDVPFLPDGRVDIDTCRWVVDGVRFEPLQGEA